MDYLDCSKLHFTSEKDVLLSCYYNDEKYESVKIYRCFPLSCPDKYLSIKYSFSDGEKELGIIKDINDLSKDDKEYVLHDLTMRYFMPEIKKIKKHTYRQKYYTFVCETNCGDKTIRVKDIIYNLFTTKNGDLLIKDCDESYYIIKDYQNKKDKNIKMLRSFL
ncbi:MAG: DUF1854 domain-containing protein [Erysipelotrichaceae bacterium]|nr:DUF1854 domain-containing protein [Erysipelotrichaceae bacterium]